jgi:hypothetical protein
MAWTLCGAIVMVLISGPCGWVWGVEKNDQGAHKFMSVGRGMRVVRAVRNTQYRKRQKRQKKTKKDKTKDKQWRTDNAVPPAACPAAGEGLVNMLRLPERDNESRGAGRNEREGGRCGVCCCDDGPTSSLIVSDGGGGGGEVGDNGCCCCGVRAADATRRLAANDGVVLCACCAC